MSSLTISGGSPELRSMFADGWQARPSDEPTAGLICWDVSASSPGMQARSLQEALLVGLNATHRLLNDQDRLERILHIVRSDHRTPLGAAANAFVGAFGKSLAREVASSGITVNMIGIPTETGQTPDYQGLIRHLAGPQSAFVTGQSFGQVGARLARPAAVTWAVPQGQGTVLVSGGSGAIGEAICQALHAAGWRVAVGYVRKEPAAALVEDLNARRSGSAIAVPVDMADPESIEQALLDDDPIQFDALVLCGGWNRTAPFSTTASDDWERTLAINLCGPARVASLVSSSSTDVAIVGIGSEAAKIGDGGRAVYAGAKAGLAAMLAAVNDPLERRFAATVSPGPVDTPLLRDTHGDQERAERGIERLRRLIPVGRLGRPEEIAAVVALALSPEGGPLGGEVISVGGGVTMQ